VGRRTPVIVWTVKDLSRKERDRLQAAVQGIVMKGDGTAALLAELNAIVPLPVLQKRARQAAHAG
jgi:hypothetical protein